MPKITVSILHAMAAKDALAKIAPALEKTAKDFQGYDLKTEVGESSASFSFKSMAFTIKGTVEASNADVTVNVDLPFAAMMFKDQAERAIAKNIKRVLEPAAADQPPQQS